MGEFYGPTLFLAESSATTGGLDSLLEPTGNIKKAQEMTGKANVTPEDYTLENQPVDQPLDLDGDGIGDACDV